MEPEAKQAAGSSGALVLQAVARTDVGVVRRNNEDTVVLGDLTTGESSFAGRIGPAGVVFGICDGMGGAAAGEIASRIAGETVREMMGLAQLDLDCEGFAKALAIAVEFAGKAVSDYAAEHPKCCGMGTTCTVGAIRGTRLVIGHVGDSRAYLLRAGELKQLTRDHNVANELLARGRITREQVADVVLGKRITQAVGSTERLEVDLVHVELTVGDRVLMCSDGLSDMVDDPSLAEVLRESSRDLDAQADELVCRAKAAGGRDNISLVLCEVVGQVGVEAELPHLDATAGDDPASAEVYRLPVSRWRLWLPAAAALLVLGSVSWWLVGTDGHTESSRTARAAQTARAGGRGGQVSALASEQAVRPASTEEVVEHDSGPPVAPPIELVSQTPRARTERAAVRGSSSNLARRATQALERARGRDGADKRPSNMPKVASDADDVLPPDRSTRNPF